MIIFPSKNYFSIFLVPQSQLSFHFQASEFIHEQASEFIHEPTQSHLSSAVTSPDQPFKMYQRLTKIIFSQSCCYIYVLLVCYKGHCQLSIHLVCYKGHCQLSIHLSRTLAWQNQRYITIYRYNQVNCAVTHFYFIDIINLEAFMISLHLSVIHIFSAFSTVHISTSV